MINEDIIFVKKKLMILLLVIGLGLYYIVIDFIEQDFKFKYCEWKNIIKSIITFILIITISSSSYSFDTL